MDYCSGKVLHEDVASVLAFLGARQPASPAPHGDPEARIPYGPPSRRVPDVSAWWATGKTGKDLSHWLSATLGLSIQGWQLLCSLAASCSLVAAVAIQLLKSENLEEQCIARAESIRAKFGILDSGRITGSVTPAQASTEYAACLELISFI